jgi:hypothetical protein
LLEFTREHVRGIKARPIENAIDLVIQLVNAEIKKCEKAKASRLN